MELELEIHQPSFKNEYQKMVINLLYTSSWLQNIVAQHLKSYGISPQQFNILRILRGQYPKPARMHLIQERMLDKMSNASRLVEKLRQKGLVERTICENDRRAVDVLITRKGMDLLLTLDQAEDTWQKKLHHLSEDEAHQLNVLLDELRG